MLGATLMLSSALALAPSAPVQRGNDVHAKRDGLVFSVSANPRLGILRAGGAQVMSPYGFGAGFSFRLHGVHLGPLRLGMGVDLGHTRFSERRTVQGMADGAQQAAQRYAALGHTHFGLGPSLQLVLGPVFLQADLTAGLGISTFVRPLGILTTDEQHHSDVSSMIRTGGLLGVPIRNNQGLTVGAGLQRYFSTYQIIAEPSDDPAVVSEPDNNPFDLMLEVSVGYVFMF